MFLLTAGCGRWNDVGALDFQPSQVPVGPLALGVWLPAGLDHFRFDAADQDLVAGLRVNLVEWLQTSVAEEAAMAFCGRTGVRMPVYYPPSGYTAYDKLHNWATREKLEPGAGPATRQLVEDLHRKWNGANGFYGYLVGHEDYREAYYPALRQVVAALRGQDPERPILTVGRIEHYQSVGVFLDAFFADGGPPNILQHEHYVFGANVPFTGRGLRRRLGHLIEGYERVARHLQGRYGRWHAVVQVHQETRDGRMFYRQPTAAEISAQVGLALARGASGIIYFLHSSGIEEVLDGQGQIRERREYLGLVDRDGGPTPAYYSVLELNRRLERLGPALEALHFHGGFGGRQPPENPVLNGGERDLQFGLFGDGVDVTHLLVVNCRTTTDRSVELAVNGEQVVEADTGEALEVRQGKARLQLAPGGFRLLAVQQDTTQ